jgi:hypothetical protein
LQLCKAGLIISKKLKKMDTGSVIVGAIIIAICIIPFVIMYYKRVIKENKMLQSLREVAQKQHNCKISQHEFCGDFVLGIDEDRDFVFFFKKKKEETISQCVDLADVRACQAIIKTGTVKTNKESVVITERVELGFMPANKSKTETRFELYGEETNMQLSEELQFVEKWSKQINERLKNRK